MFPTRFLTDKEKHMSPRRSRRRNVGTRMTQCSRHTLCIICGMKCVCVCLCVGIILTKIKPGIPSWQKIYLGSMDLWGCRDPRANDDPDSGDQRNIDDPMDPTIFAIPSMMPFHNRWIHKGNYLAPIITCANHTFHISVHIYYRERLICIIRDVIPI